MKILSYVLFGGFLVGLSSIMVYGIIMTLLTSCSFNQIQTDTHGQSSDTVRESSHATAETEADIPINPKP
jgi:hypothetical protein